MAQNESTQIQLPAGRMVGGDCNAGRIVEKKGVPVLDRNGKKLERRTIGVAIAKTKQRWQDEDWGAKIFAVGVAAHGNACRNATYSWKILDGDSQEPNKKGNRNCDKTGYQGNWVVWADWTFEIPFVNKAKTPILPHEIQRGDMVGVILDARSNGSSESIGLYLTAKAIIWLGLSPLGRIAYTDRVNFDNVDFDSYGDYESPSTQTMPPAIPPAQPPAMLPAQPPAMLPAQPPAQPPAMPPAMPYAMTAKAGQFTLDDFLRQGWKIPALLAQGYIISTNNNNAPYDDDIPF